MRKALYEDRDNIIKFREAAFERQRGLCFWCKRPMKERISCARVDDPLGCTADHVVWRSRGGTNEEGNIVAACFMCNTSRHPPPHTDPLDGARDAPLDWPWLEALVSKRVQDVGWGPW